MHDKHMLQDAGWQAYLKNIYTVMSTKLISLGSSEKTFQAALVIMHALIGLEQLHSEQALDKQALRLHSARAQ